MLVNVHNPTLDEVKSFPNANAFNVVTISDGHTGGKVDLFIAADWSDWDAMVAKVTQYRTAQRLEHLRSQIRAENISYGEIAELQSLADHIGADDVELREWAGMPEHVETDA